MKSMLLAALAAMFVAGAAFAGEGNDDGCPGNSCHGGSSASTSTSGAEASASASASAKGGSAKQSQSQEQGNVQVTETSVNTRNDAPASSAAGLFLANCTSGASAQGFGGGGSLGGPDDVCLLLNLSQVAALEGNREVANSALQRAVDLMNIRTNVVVRYLQAIPVLRHIF